MASTKQQPSGAAPRLGFVVAMRARLISATGPACYEWIIVSRWGTGGEHLSIGRTRVPALRGKTAPIHLAPRQSALASLLRLPPAAAPPIFLFARRQPASVSVAGDFAPAEGYLRLHDRGAALRLRAEGRCVACSIRPAWRVEAVRVAWIGEFIEGAAVSET
jgi:hypothetical protein